jgi:hypothetical protein
MKRIFCSLLVATLPFGSVLADAPKSKNAKVTLVYQHELPNVPGKSIKGVLVEYGPGGYSPGHTHSSSGRHRKRRPLGWHDGLGCNRGPDAEPDHSPVLGIAKRYNPFSCTFLPGRLLVRARLLCRGLDREGCALRRRRAALPGVPRSLFRMPWQQLAV